MFEQARVAGGVEVGAVVEGVGVARQLDAEVAVGAAAGVHCSASQGCEGVGELVALGVVDQVAALDDRVGSEVSYGV